MKGFWKFGLLCIVLLMAGGAWASIPQEGLGNASELAGIPTSIDAAKVDLARGGRSPLDLTAINNGTFGGAPYARDDAAAVNYFKAQATAIGAGGYTSDVDYRTLESAIISFDNHGSYVTDRGGCIYIQTVLTGLVAGDIVQVDNNYFYDDGTGYASFWDQLPYWLLVGTYTHNPVNTINNWLIYVEEVSPGNYTAVIGSGEYNLALNNDDMTVVIGDKFKLTREVRVWQGATLVSPLISSRGYTYSAVGITGGTEIGSNSLDTGDLTIVGSDPVWVDDDWSANDNGDVVSGHTFGQDAFANIQHSTRGVSGSTINVLAGVYHERLTLTSGLDLRGAQYGVDPTPGGARTNPAAESIIDLVGVPISNPNFLIKTPIGVTNVNIEGFTLNGSPTLNYSDESTLYCWDDHITIQDNIIDGYSSVLYKGNDYFTVNRNRITANLQCVVVQGSAATYVTISNNKMIPGSNPVAGNCKPIYLTGDAHTVISGNVANGFTQYAALSGSNHTDVNVSGNTFSGNLKGVSFWGNTTFITISGNTLSNSVGGSGIEIKGQDITITGNTISGNSTDGIMVAYHVIPTERVEIHNNTITGNGNKALEVTPAVTQTVDAEQNYWGTTDYCSLPPLISGNADYDPWCDAGPSNCTFTALTSTTVHNVTQGTHFCSLTAALTAAAPGDEIHADAGAIYYEHDVPITKSVTLIGVPGDATPGCGANAPIVDGQDLHHYGFLFGANVSDVTISGFEIRNYVGPLDGDGDAFQAWYTNTNNITITDNTMHHLGANGVLVGSDAGSGGHFNWTIARNLLTDFGPPTGWGLDQGYGLELTNASNSVIEDNDINAGSRYPAMGLRVSGRLAYQSDVTVRNNRVRGAYERCAIQVNARDGENLGATLDGVTVEHNDIEISYAPRVVYLYDHLNTGTAVLTNVVIYDNKLVSLDNQLRVESFTDQTMNASGNWWGDNTPAGLAAKMVGPVDYVPWLNTGTDLNAGLPFHGDFSVLWVDDIGQQSGAIGRIQEAINMVSGSTVNVLPGTYYEHDITVPGAITLNGDPGDATAGPGPNAPVVDGQDLYTDAFLIANGASNVTIQGFEIRNYVTLNPGSNGEGNAVQAWVASTDHVTIADNYMHNLDWNGVLVGNDGAIGDHSYWTIVRNVLEDYGPSSFGNAGYGFELTNTSHGLIEDNEIDAGTGYPGIAILVTMRRAYGNDIVIRDNHIRGNFDNAGIYVAGMGYEVTGAHLEDVTIDSNDVEIGGARVLNLRDYATGLLTNADVHNNKLVSTDGHLSLQNLTAETIDASCNWWGTLNCTNIDNQISGPATFEPWTDADFTPCTYTCANTFDFTLLFDQSVIGCNPGCNTTLLKVAFERADFHAGQLIISLQDGFYADWSDAPYYEAMPPAGPQRSDNLLHAYATGGGTQTITLDLLWDNNGSSGAPGQFVAYLPVEKTTAGDGTYSVTAVVGGTGFGFFDMDEVEHGTGDFDFSFGNVYVDCFVPSFTPSFTPYCAAVNEGADFVGMYGFIVDGTVGANQSPVTEVTVTVGTATLTFNPNIYTYNRIDFPVVAEANALYAGMGAEGCYDMVFTWLDEECNSGTTTIVGAIVKDTAIPTLAVTDGLTDCYNNASASAALASDLDIDVSGYAASCVAASGTMTITSVTNPGGTPYTLALTGDLVDFPGLTYNAALWTWMTTAGQGNVPAGANGETYTFSVIANDCAGNVTAAQTFDLCLDFTAPNNIVSGFDARPADAGVWLNWSWVSGPQAAEMAIYRSPLSDPIEYPAYPGDLHSTYDGSYPPAGWTEVARQVVADADFSSNDMDNAPADYNNRGDFHKHGTYWLDAQTGWVNADNNADEWRDVYRYVTFIKDAAGNWSSGFTVGTNADHATNYWLGDFVPADMGGLSSSKGHVDTEDLGVLSAVYFTNQVAPRWADVGPVITPVENGSMSKSIPNPNGGTINFQDLVVFGFNYGTVSPTDGSAGEYSVPIPPTAPTFDQLDSEPVVTLTRTDEVIEVGEEFTVTATLSGNEANILRAAEVEVAFDPDVLEFVSATESGLGMTGEGVIFTKAELLEDHETVGLVAGACGGNAMLAGDGNLGTITFKWIAEQTGNARIALSSVKLADGSGEVIEYEGSALTLGAEGVIPAEYALHQNYPNPFNPTTHIRFDLPEDANVRLVIFNVMGQEVRTLISGSTPAGIHTITWDGMGNDDRDVGTGLYIYRITANHFSATQKMLLTR